MDILFLTMSPVNSIDEQGIYPDLMRELVKSGHKPCIVSPAERREHIPTRYTDHGDHAMLRVCVGNSTGVSFIEKGITTLLFGWQYTRAIRRYCKGAAFDLILYSTPPITLYSTVRSLKKTFNARTYLMLKDIFPQNAVDLELMHREGLIYRYFRGMEKKLYAISDKIGCMSSGNRDYILAHNQELSPDKVEVFPNAISIMPLGAHDDKALVRHRLRIPENACVFLLGGNMGKPQCIDLLCELVKRLADRKDVYFLFAGSGNEKGKLDGILQEGIINAQVLPTLSAEDYREVVYACDVGLVTLDPRFTIPNYPSRILTYLECAKPVLLISDKITDLRTMIEDAHCGIWAWSEYVDEAARAVEKCLTMDRVQMGLNGRRYCEREFNVENIAHRLTLCVRGVNEGSSD